MIKFAIVGCGRISERHAQIIQRVGNLIAVCDIIKDKADVFAKKYNCKAYYNLNEMLSKEKSVELVSICSPNGLHASQSIECLKNDFHVLCEKPMAIDSNDCYAMIEMARIANKKLFIVKQNRFNPPVAAIKKIIDEGRLGKIFTIQLSCFWNRPNEYYQNSWKGTKKFDGGVLYTQFSHFIDLLCWIIGDFERVEAITANYAHEKIIEFEDSGIVLIKFLNGTMGTINYSVNSFKKNMEGSLTILAEKGSVKIGGEYLNKLEYQNIEDYFINNLPNGNHANNYDTYKGSMSNHDKVYSHIIEALSENKKDCIDIIEDLKIDLKTIQLIEAIYTSAKKKNKVF